MNLSNRKGWLGLAILVGIAYVAFGIVFGELAKGAASERMRFTWRLAAWIASAVVYAGHIGYEKLGRRNPSHIAALHVAIAAAFGAFLLAVAASVHRAMVPSHATPRLFIAALVVWPIVTGLPAFVVAFLACAALAWIRR